EEEDRRAVAGAAQLAEDRPAVALREHHVEDDEVEAAGAGFLQAVVAITADFDVEAVLGQAALQVGSRFALVFDDQDPLGHGLALGAQLARLYRGRADSPTIWSLFDCMRRDGAVRCCGWTRVQTSIRNRRAMQRRNGDLVFAPTDLVNFLGCPHATVLDMRHA